MNDFLFFAIMTVTAVIGVATWIIAFSVVT